MGVLNVFDYKIKFVNVDDKVTKLSQRALEALEFVWLPYSVSKDFLSSGISRLPIESRVETIGSGSGYGSGYSSGYGAESFEMEVRTTIHNTLGYGRGYFDVEITNVTRPDQRYKYRNVPLPYPFTYLYPVSYVTNPISMG